MKPRNRFPQCSGVKFRPMQTGEIQLRKCALPQHEIAQPLLLACPEEQIHACGSTADQAIQIRDLIVVADTFCSSERLRAATDRVAGRGF